VPKKLVKLKSKDMLGGFSAFGFGISFKPQEADRTVVRDLLIFLEDRRALYVACIWEQPDHVVQSVLEMRNELTNALTRLGDKSPAADACRLMRSACRNFLNSAGQNAPRGGEALFARDWRGESFLLALGGLRATFGQQIALMSHLYAVDVEGHLADILPPVPDDK
jgi:hypothetical protein